MLTVSKECHFDAAHVLPDHQGQCKNLHGHTYRLLVEVAEGYNGNDMVIDFKDLKRIVGEVILSRFDHAFIYDQTNEMECDIAATLTKYSLRCVALPFKTTAENLARYIFQELKPHLQIQSVYLYETPESYARYSAE
jgi:6-pyruvoyltetrahydropterin/6-carboxytetrahydropterin synthase